MKRDEDRIYTSIANMRAAMLKAHPEKLGASCSDVLECCLNVEEFQKELIKVNTSALKALKMFFAYYKPDVLPAGQKELLWNDFVQAADDALNEAGSVGHRYDVLDKDAEVIFFDGRKK